MLASYMIIPTHTQMDQQPAVHEGMEGQAEVSSLQTEKGNREATDHFI